MKKLLFILSIMVMVFAPAGCFYMDDAKTVYPGDESFNNPTPPLGGINTLTATVSGLSEGNPYITIIFSSPINAASVNYDVNVIVEYPDGITTLAESVDYIGITNTSNIILDLTPATPTTLTTVRVQLTAGINAESDNSVSLTPVNVTRTLPLP